MKTFFRSELAKLREVEQGSGVLDFSKYLVEDPATADRGSATPQIVYESQDKSQADRVEGSILVTSTPKRGRDISSSLIGGDSTKKVRFDDLNGRGKEGEGGEIERLKEENMRLEGLYNRALREKLCQTSCAKEKILLEALEEKFKTFTLVSKKEVEIWEEERRRSLELRVELDSTKQLLLRAENELSKVLARD